MMPGRSGLAMIAAVLAALSVAARAAEQRPWVHSFTPKRQMYVSPDGNGAGASVEAPMSLQAAVAGAQPGDLCWLLEGDYKVGTLALLRNGAKEQPIVFRAAPGKRVRLVGKIDVKGAYNWVWGLEITDPDAGGPKGNSGSVFAGAPGVHIINNVIHDTWEAGIGGWANGPDHVYYGNIIYDVGKHKEPGARNYPIYTQNNFARSGYKYIVQNMFLDQRPDVGGPGFNFHAYTERGFLSGFVVRQNVVSRGRFILGGANEPHHHNVVEGNLFYDIPWVEFGYRRPIQVEFKDNYLGRTGLETDFFWGVGEGRQGLTKPLPNIYTGNTIVHPPGPHIVFRTCEYVAGQRADGKVPIDPKDVFDGNVYAGDFRARFSANGKQADCDLAAWQRETAAAGKAFDEKAKVVPAPKEPKVFLLVNEYESGRAHLVIFNWSKAAEASVDLSPLASRGAQFTIHPAKSAYGEPVAAGRYDGPVKVPTGGEEFLVFLVRCAVPAL